MEPNNFIGMCKNKKCKPEVCFYNTFVIHVVAVNQPQLLGTHVCLSVRPPVLVFRPSVRPFRLYMNI